MRPGLVSEVKAAEMPAWGTIQNLIDRLAKPYLEEAFKKVKTGKVPFPATTDGHIPGLSPPSKSFSNEFLGVSSSTSKDKMGMQSSSSTAAISMEVVSGPFNQIVSAEELRRKNMTNSSTPPRLS